MSHLSSERISNWVLGDRDIQTQEHLRACAECRLEVSEVERVLSGFRGSLELWSAQSAPPAFRSAAQQSHRSPALRWALAAAALFVLAVFPILRIARERERVEAAARADELLLQQVDASLSRTVPASMEPLMRLMSSNGNEDRQ